MTDARDAGAAGGYSRVSYRRPTTGTPAALVVPAPLPRAPSLDPAPHARDALLCPCAALRDEIAPGVRRGAGSAEVLAVEVATRVGDRGAAVMAHHTPICRHAGLFL